MFSVGNSSTSIIPPAAMGVLTSTSEYPSRPSSLALYIPFSVIFLKPSLPVPPPWISVILFAKSVTLIGPVVLDFARIASAMLYRVELLII
jgi:hypothetical protein